MSALSETTRIDTSITWQGTRDNLQAVAGVDERLVLNQVGYLDHSQCLLLSNRIGWGKMEWSGVSCRPQNISYSVERHAFIAELKTAWFQQY